MRAAAFQLVAEVGKGNDRVLGALLSALKEKSFQIRFSALQSLGTLRDPRAIPALEELAKSSDIPAFAKQMIAGVINQIKNPKQEEKKD